MKERAALHNIPIPKKVGFKSGKSWMKVNSGTHPNDLKGVNQTIEMVYHRILKTVKSEYLKPQTLYFERDYKFDFSDPFALHSFVCDNFSLYLECDYLCQMRIEYDFYDFKQKDEVLQLLRYVISRGSCFHKAHTPDLPAFFKRVIAYQDKQFIHAL